MVGHEAALAAWEQRLRLADEDLRQREQQALAQDPTPAELLALSAEHDKIALDRDSIAASYDEIAAGRDSAGLGRDVARSGRDRRVRALRQDLDPASGDRALAGQDRDFAAGDRGDSYDDRARSRQARDRAAADRVHAAEDRDRAEELVEEQGRELEGLRTALESRLVIGQAQGLLMARHQMSSQTAFSVLVRLSQQSNTKLREVAERLVAAAQLDDA